jgi:hypothetical protein
MPAPAPLGERLTSGALLDVFGDDFDDVVAAVFAGGDEAPAWLSAAPAGPPAKAGPARTAAPARAAPQPAAGVQTVVPLHRCVNPTHSAPCAWCACAPGRAVLHAHQPTPPLGPPGAAPDAASRPRCTPAPTAEDELEYELVGDPGKV